MEGPPRHATDAARLDTSHRTGAAYRHSRHEGFFFEFRGVFRKYRPFWPEIVLASADGGTGKTARIRFFARAAMSDEWYVLVDHKIRGPATTSQLRKSLEAGKIIRYAHPRRDRWRMGLDSGNPRIGAGGRGPPGDKDSILLAGGAAPQTGPSRRLAGWLIAGGALVLASLGGVVFAVVHWNRATAPEKPSVAAVASPAAGHAAIRVRSNRRLAPGARAHGQGLRTR